MANGAHRVLNAGCLGKTADLVDCRACKTPSFAIRCICLAAPVATSLIPRRRRSTAWIVLMISNAYAIRGESKKKSSMRTRLLLNQSVTTHRSGAPRSPARRTVPGTLQSAGHCAVRDAMKGAHTLRRATGPRGSWLPPQRRQPNRHRLLADCANLTHLAPIRCTVSATLRQPTEQFVTGVWRRPRSDGWVDNRAPTISRPRLRSLSARIGSPPGRLPARARPPACNLHDNRSGRPTLTHIGGSRIDVSFDSR